MQRIPLLMIMVLLTACGAASGTTVPPTVAIPTASGNGAATAPAATAPAATALPAATAAAQPTGAAMIDPNNPTVALAISDLATRTGVSASAITVKSVEAVEWRNGSLGCPQPGQSYTQVIIPGYTIVLEANGTAYNYHTDTGKQVVLCTNPTSFKAQSS